MLVAAARIGDGVILHQGLSDRAISRATGWALAEGMRQRLEAIPGLVEVSTDDEGGGMQVDVTIDRDARSNAFMRLDLPTFGRPRSATRTPDR